MAREALLIRVEMVASSLPVVLALGMLILARVKVIRSLITSSRYSASCTVLCAALLPFSPPSLRGRTLQHDRSQEGQVANGKHRLRARSSPLNVKGVFPESQGSGV